ncbi:hypothetical protein C5167_022411 [Papaver somniferum]|uniref:Phytocyanin domain-containing protein n=1 Tax=Papaver somniferum TaxID=3469 RepID=A0A4Y7JKZ7_PAPSO|nr:blue copper protein-like [Papaver somniferum]RZC60651.1 hypothetical protein C5167_022411 [Papaver somniferum]
MNGVCLVMVLYALALGTAGTLAAKHVVTWDLSSDMNSWAKGKTFKVGDQLVFKYSSGLHSVVELSSEKEYKNCDIGNALDSKSSGSDEFKLTKAGTRYFACGTMGHCDQGMKVQIKTVAAGTDSSSSSSDDDQDSSSSTPSSTSSPSSTTSTTSAAGVQSVAYLLLIFALVGTMSLFYVV